MLHTCVLAARPLQVDSLIRCQSADPLFGRVDEIVLSLPCQATLSQQYLFLLSPKYKSDVSVSDRSSICCFLIQLNNNEATNFRIP